MPDLSDLGLEKVAGILLSVLISLSSMIPQRATDEIK